jgi:hypothetical protein
MRGFTFCGAPFDSFPGIMVHRMNELNVSQPHRARVEPPDFLAWQPIARTGFDVAKSFLGGIGSVLPPGSVGQQTWPTRAPFAQPLRSRSTAPPDPTAGITADNPSRPESDGTPNQFRDRPTILVVHRLTSKQCAHIDRRE